MFDKFFNIPVHLSKIIEFKTAGVVPPNKVIFGFQSTNTVGYEAAKYGDRVMIVSDTTMQSIGVTDSINEILRNHDLEVDLFTSVEPEPHMETVENLYDQCKQSESSVIIGVGGGSVMDVSKLAAQSVGEGNRPIEYVKGSTSPIKDGLPLILIPTTSGTGSEVSPYTVMMIGDRKQFLSSDFYYPDMAIIDPALTITMPSEVTASTGIDALSHAIESIMHQNANDFTYTFARTAIEMISRYLRSAVMNGEDLEARYYMSMAATMAMLALSTSGGLYAHSVSFVLTKYNPTPHGVGCGLGLPYLMDYNRPLIKEKLIKIAVAFGERTYLYSDEDVAKKSVFSVIDIMKDCRLPVALKDCEGFKEEDLTDMAELMVNDYPRPMNPRKMTYEDAKKYWRNIWFGTFNW